MSLRIELQLGLAQQTKITTVFDPSTNKLVITELSGHSRFVEELQKRAESEGISFAEGSGHIAYQDLWSALAMNKELEMPDHLRGDLQQWAAPILSVIDLEPATINGIRERDYVRFFLGEGKGWFWNDTVERIQIFTD